jgi:hypothetical protein
MPTPVPDVVVALATTLYAASAPIVVLNQAPVLMLDRVLEPALCAALVDHWQQGNKLVDGVASAVGANRADVDIKRRADVPLDDKQLFVLVRDCLVPAGGAMVFLCSLSHEAMPVTRGRRFALFTFLHDERHDAQYRRLIADQKARASAGVRMRDERGI